MEVYIELDQGDLVRTNCETVSGKVVVESNSHLNISSITVTLAGISVSRSRISERSETHKVIVISLISEACIETNIVQLFEKSEKLFPEKSLPEHSLCGLLLGDGKHTFPFLIRVYTLKGATLF
jgi:hypothetical protein